MKHTNLWTDKENDHETLMLSFFYETFIRYKSISYCNACRVLVAHTLGWTIHKILRLIVSLLFKCHNKVCFAMQWWIASCHAFSRCILYMLYGIKIRWVCKLFNLMYHFVFKIINICCMMTVGIITDEHETIPNCAIKTMYR